MPKQLPGDHIPIGGSGNYDYEGGGSGGATSLTDLNDVTGDPGPGKAPVANEAGDEFPLTHVVTQADLDAILEEVVWHRVREMTGDWQPSNPTVVMTPDGVVLGPYADGAAAGGSIRYLGLAGQPFSVVENLAYQGRFTCDNWSGG